MECHIITGVMKNLSQDGDGQGHCCFFLIQAEVREDD